MRTRLYIGVLLILSLTVVAVFAQDDTEEMMVDASATLENVDGEEIGMVTFTIDEDDKVTVTAHIDDLPPGFHGFHIHAVGSCDDSGNGPFTAAGGHFNPMETNHPEHAGDLPTLLVNSDGTGYLSVTTDRFTLDELFDEDGSAMIVHANADNFANIPERYGGPDEETLNAGDSGDRIACGVITEGGSMDMLEETPEPTPSG